jgi:sporulation protein YlmC with PRC-barrel domain
MSRHLDLACDVLDHELVDIDGLPCGMVDDIELAGELGTPLEVTALLVGPGAWGPRLPALPRFLVRLVGGARRTRVPWAEVERVTERVHLRSRATQLGLGIRERKARRWIAWVPLNEHEPE